MKKCKYCNKKNIEDDFCSDDCKNKGERYFNYWKKYKYFFGLIIAISIFVIIMQVALYPEYIIVSKILTLVLGLTFFIFPFGNTIDSIGIKNTVYIVRTISTILIILGIVSIVFDFIYIVNIIPRFPPAMLPSPYCGRIEGEKASLSPLWAAFQSGSASLPSAHRKRRPAGIKAPK